MSPIRGLTHREASFPMLGAIRKGAPKKPDRPGADLDHFRVEFDEMEKDAAGKFVAVYGEEPREINILLPFNSVDQNFQAWQESYVRSGLIHRCDGDWVVDLHGFPVIFVFCPSDRDIILANMPPAR